MNQLHPKAIWLFFTNQAFSIFISFFIFGFAATQAFIPAFIEIFRPSSVSSFVFQIMTSVIVMFIFSILTAYVWANLKYKNYRYELTENVFKKEHGIIWKKYVSIPYDRIQNVDIHRGLLARMLGLSDLNIQTAGSSMSYGQYGGAEGRLPGLSVEDAERMRDELISRAQKFRNQGL